MTLAVDDGLGEEFMSAAAVGKRGGGTLKIFVDPCVAIVRRTWASRVREREIWSFERRPPP